MNDEHQHDEQDDRQDDHRDLRTAIGPLLLGHLGAAEAARVEAHLATCATCREERDELLPVVAELARLRDGGPVADPVAVLVDPTGPGLEPPAALAGRVARAVAAETPLAQRRHRRATRRGRPALPVLTGLGGAAAAAAVTALLLTGPLAPDVPPAGPLEPVTVVADPGLRADADLVPHTWGVEVKLTGSGFEAGAVHRVVVVGSDGTRYPAGQFVGTGSAELRCNLNSAVLREDARAFEVRGPDGEVLVRSDFSRPASA